MYSIFDKLINDNNIKVSDVSKSTGIRASTFSDWKAGRYTPKQDKLQKIADYFGVSIEYLMTGNTPSTPKLKGVKIPVVGKVIAGVPIEAIEEILDYEEITEEMASKGEHFGLKIKGDSMYPSLMEDDTIIVRKQEDVESGQIAVVLVNGEEATVKKIKKTEDSIMLIPINPNYEITIYNNEEVKKLPLTIIGRVVENRRTFL